MISRRDFGKLVAAALPVCGRGAAKIDSRIRGVQFGLQTYVFNGIGLPQASLIDVIVKCMVESGLGECDLFAPVVEPAEFWNRIRAGGGGRGGAAVSPEAAAAGARAREELATWRATVSLDYYRAIRRKFDDAGITIHGLSAFPLPPKRS